MASSPIIYNSYPSTVKHEIYEDLIKAIEDRDNNGLSKYITALICVALVTVAEISLFNYAIVTFILITAGVVLFGVISWKSKEKKKNIAKYVFTNPKSSVLFEELKQLLLSLNDYQTVWCIAPALEKGYCPATNENRSKLKVDLEQPELFSVDFPLPSIKFAKLGKDVFEYYILPDSILLKTKDGIRICPFAEIEVSRNYIDIAEYEGKAPEDAQLVGRRWMHERVSGGPDLRYKYNPQVGVYRYYQIQFKHDSHVVLSFLTTKSDGFDDLVLYFQELRNKIKNLDQSVEEVKVEAPHFSSYVEQPTVKKTKTLFFCSDGEEEHLKIFNDLDSHFGPYSVLHSNDKDTFDEQQIVDCDVFLCVIDKLGTNQTIYDSLKLAFDLNKDVFIVDPYNNQCYRDQLKRCRRSIYVLSDIDQYNRLFLDLYPILGLTMPASSTIVGHTINLAVHSKQGFIITVDGEETRYDEPNKILDYCFNKGKHKFIVSNMDNTALYSNEFVFETCTWKSEFCIKYDLMFNFDSFIQMKNLTSSKE